MISSTPSAIRICFVGFYAQEKAPERKQHNRRQNDPGQAFADFFTKKRCESHSIVPLI
jgi:hypothetical protein